MHLTCQDQMKVFTTIFFFFFKKQNTLFKILNVNNNKIINYTKLKAMLAGNDQYKKPC